RGIMLLLALPGLLLFSRPQVPTRLRRLSWITVILILLVMFRIPISGYLATHNVRVQNSAFAALIWMLFELAWWWIVSFLLMLLSSSIFHSKASLQATRFFGCTWQVKQPPK